MNKERRHTTSASGLTGGVRAADIRNILLSDNVIDNCAILDVVNEVGLVSGLASHDGACGGDGRKNGGYDGNVENHFAGFLVASLKSERRMLEMSD